MWIYTSLTEEEKRELVKEERRRCESEERKRHVEEERRRRAEEERKRRELQRERRNMKLCQHCGGQFKGIFRKTCGLCGKEKDY